MKAAERLKHEEIPGQEIFSDETKAINNNSLTIDFLPDDFSGDSFVRLERKKSRHQIEKERRLLEIWAGVCGKK